MPHAHSNSETKFGLPFFLEDKTGRLTGSEFIDLHERMKLTYCPRSRDPSLGIYDIYDVSSGRRESYEIPVITLAFGPNNSLGTIKFVHESTAREMGNYLSQVNVLGGCVSLPSIGWIGFVYMKIEVEEVLRFGWE